MLLEDFLARQESLKFAFFNACSTRQWAENLVRLGVPCIIATSRPVKDEMALAFASAFYQYLASDATIAEAFEKARSSLGFTDESEAMPQPIVRAPDLKCRSIDEAEDSTPLSTEFPWAVYSRDASAAEWKLSVGAHDPLIGLPPLDLTSYPLPESPYVSIKGHTPADAPIFFGRNAEIRSLYDWMLRSPGDPPILLFYGQSGVGKSSLLNAGLLPRLQQHVEVVYLRRNLDLTDDLHRAIGGATDEAALAWLNSETPKLIILDQVEEAITHDDGTKAEMRTFIDRLIRIFAHRKEGSTARLILSFRKEYLAEIRNGLVAGAPDDAPLVKDFWLERLDFEGVTEIVKGPMRSRPLREKYRITLANEDLPGDIAHDVDDRNSPIATVLQIILNQLWKAAKQKDGDPVYSRDLYKSLSDTDNPLQGFFDDRIAQLETNTGGIVNNDGLELDLLYEYTTPFVTSRRRTLADLKKCYPQIPDIERLITRNKELYLLAEPAKESGGISDDSADAGQVTALAHDTLAPVIRREFELSVKRGSRARRLLENRGREWANGKIGDTLDRADLRVVKKGRDQMRALTADEERMVRASARKVRRSSLLQRTIVGTLVVAAVVLLVGQQAITINSLANQADLIAKTDPFSAGVHYLDAAVRFQRSWRMKASLHPGLHAQLQMGVLGVLRSPEVDRIRDNAPLKFVGACGYTFNSTGVPVYQVNGALSNWTPLMGGGTALPEYLKEANPIGDCDPVSQTFVAIDSRIDSTGLLIWSKGKVSTLEAPKEMVTVEPHAVVDCGARTTQDKKIAKGLTEIFAVKVDTAKKAELNAAAKEDFAACQASNLTAHTGVVSVSLPSGAGRIAVVLASGVIQVLDRASGKLTVIGGGDSGSRVTFSDDARYLAQGNVKTNVVMVWDLAIPGRARLAGMVQDATLAAFGGTVNRPILATAGQKTLQIFLLASFDGTGPAPKPRPGTGYGSGPVTALAVSKDGTFVALSEPGGEVRNLLIPPDLDFGKKNEHGGPAGFDQSNFLSRSVNTWQMSEFTAGDGIVQSMAFGADSTLLVTVSEQDGSHFIKTWNLTNVGPGLFSPFSEVVVARCKSWHTYIWRNAGNSTPDLGDFDFGELKKNCSAALGER